MADCRNSFLLSLHHDRPSIVTPAVAPSQHNDLSQPARDVEEANAQFYPREDDDLTFGVDKVEDDVFMAGGQTASSRPAAILEASGQTSLTGSQASPAVGHISPAGSWVLQAGGQASLAGGQASHAGGQASQAGGQASPIISFASPQAGGKTSQAGGQASLAGCQASLTGGTASPMMSFASPQAGGKASHADGLQVFRRYVRIPTYL